MNHKLTNNKRYRSTGTPLLSTLIILNSASGGLPRIIRGSGGCVIGGDGACLIHCLLVAVTFAQTLALVLKVT